MGDLLDQLLDELAERLADRVVQRLRSAAPGMVAQTGSPLGTRRHCSAVRHRVARCEHGAAIVGRKHLLSPEALNEELTRVSTRTAYRPPEETAADKLRRDLGLPPAGSVRAEL
jgi:hypothetical protein